MLDVKKMLTKLAEAIRLPSKVHVNKSIGTQAGVDVPEAATTIGSIMMYSKDPVSNFYCESRRTTSDAVYQSFVTRRLNADGNRVSHGFYLNVLANGDKTVSFVDAASRLAWLTEFSKAVETFSYTMPSTVGFSGFRIRKWGPVVSITVNNPNKAKIGSNAICTLPAGWRPGAKVAFPLVQPTGNTPTANNLSMRLTVDTTGEIELYNYRSSAITANTNASGVLTYIAEQ